jgi:ABC-type branched-subunit amino acid transport system ATPase component
VVEELLVAPVHAHRPVRLRHHALDEVGARQVQAVTGDRLALVLEEGRVVAEGAPAALRTRPELRRAYLG